MFFKIGVLKILRISQENTCVEVSFYKVAGPQLNTYRILLVAVFVIRVSDIATACVQERFIKSAVFGVILVRAFRIRTE